MKKIMFNDRYGLTKAVLEGRKTQTRRIVSQSLIDKYDEWYDDVCCIARPSGSVIETLQNWLLRKHTRFYVGEVVAVAQSYRDCGGVNEYGVPMWEIISQRVGSTNAGWDNKMFVRADMMPHQIRITDVRVERLQDISDECCLKEGIIKKWHTPACKNYYYVPGVEVKSVKDVHDTPQEAFAHLINKVSGKGTWESNPYVWVYDFELVK